MERSDTSTRRDPTSISLAKIKGYIPVSMLDWDGKLATTIFLGGCNLSCPYCHNHKLAHHPESLLDIPWNDIEGHLQKKRGWVDGCVVTGGEPLFNHGLTDLLLKIKELDYPVKLDTNGTLPKDLSQIIQNGLVDYLAMDIKSSPEKYSFTVKKLIEPDSIIESINLIMNAGIDYEFRTTVVPGIVERDDILNISTLIAGADRYFLQQFNPLNAFSDEFTNLEPYDNAVLKEFHEEASLKVPTFLRGV